MKHPTSRSLYEYWNGLRAGRAVPKRSDIEPSDLRHLLRDMFMLEIGARDSFAFRLAGTRFCSLFCRELTGQNFLDLWRGDDRDGVHSLLWTVATDASAAVIGWHGTAPRGHGVDCELVLLPLAHGDDTRRRVLGAAAPMETPYWLGLHPIVESRITSLRLVHPDAPLETLRHAGEPPVFTRALPSARVGHLAVYEGGRR